MRLIYTGIIRKMREIRIVHVIRTASEAIQFAMGNEYMDSGADYDFLGGFWHAATKMRGGLLAKSAGEISESPYDLIRPLGEVVKKMGTHHNHSYVMDKLKLALRGMDDHSIRHYWRIDSAFIHRRRVMSGVTR